MSCRTQLSYKKHKQKEKGYKKWDLVLIKLPANKKRPAVVISPERHNEKNDIIMSGENVFDLISSGKLEPATDTDKAKIVLMVKGF